jgi:hypothetical protein
VYGILGEDDSDVETLKVLVQRIIKDRRLKIITKGFGCCGDMLNKGKRELISMKGLGCKKFIICHDSDENEPVEVRKKVHEMIVKPSGLAGPFCIVVPVREIEAWILADIGSVTNVISSWKPSPIKTSTERIAKPKEHLEKLSRSAKGFTRYDYTIHNPSVAKHLDLEVVRRKCPSFHPLYDFLMK